MEALPTATMAPQSFKPLVPNDTLGQAAPAGRAAASGQGAAKKGTVPLPKATVKMRDGISVRPVCKYGTKCSRRNPQHWIDFVHEDNSAGPGTSSVKSAAPPQPRSLKTLHDSRGGQQVPLNATLRHRAPAHVKPGTPVPVGRTLYHNDAPGTGTVPMGVTLRHSSSALPRHLLGSRAASSATLGGAKMCKWGCGRRVTTGDAVCELLSSCCQRCGIGQGSGEHNSWCVEHSPGDSTAARGSMVPPPSRSMRPTPIDKATETLLAVDHALELKSKARACEASGDIEGAKKLLEESDEQLEAAKSTMPKDMDPAVQAAWKRAGDLASGLGVVAESDENLEDEIDMKMEKLIADMERVGGRASSPASEASRSSEAGEDTALVPVDALEAGEGTGYSKNPKAKATKIDVKKAQEALRTLGFDDEWPTELSLREIRRRYMREAMASHPDKGDPSEKAERTQRFQEVTEAYALLEVYISILESGDPEDDDTEYQEELTFSMTVQNVDYNKLTADASLQDQFVDTVCEVVAEESGDMIGTEHVNVVLSPGSVITQPTIVCPSWVSSKAVLAKLGDVSRLAKILEQRLPHLSGMQAALTGLLRVTNVTTPQVFSRGVPKEEQKALEYPEPRLPIPFLVMLLAVCALGFPLDGLLGACNSVMHWILFIIGLLLALPLLAFLVLDRVRGRGKMLEHFVAGDYTNSSQYRHLNLFWYPLRLQLLDRQTFATWETRQAWFKECTERETGAWVRKTDKTGHFEATLPSCGWTDIPVTLGPRGELQGSIPGATFDGSFIEYEDWASAFEKLGFWRFDVVLRVLGALAMLGCISMLAAVALPPHLGSTADLRMPLKAFFLIDGSASITDAQWPTVLRATNAIINQFEDVYSRAPGMLNFGLIQFANKSRVEHPLTDSLKDVTGMLNGDYGHLEQMKGGTFYRPALELCQKGLSSYERFAGRETFDVCVLITDGIDISGTPVDEFRTYVERETAVFGIFVAKGDSRDVRVGRWNLHRISTCGRAENASDDDSQRCEFFATAEDFDALRSKAHDVAADVTEASDLMSCVSGSIPILGIIYPILAIPYIAWWFFSTVATIVERRVEGHQLVPWKPGGAEEGYTKLKPNPDES